MKRKLKELPIKFNALDNLSSNPTWSQLTQQKSNPIVRRKFGRRTGPKFIGEV